jgi:mediator of RNA polymerase II transcription subunit 12
VQATRQIPDQWQDHHEQLRASSRYADFLFNLGEEMPTTLDDSLRPHLSASYKDNLAPDLDVDSWNLIVHLLLELVSRGGLSTITVLEGIIYPAWTASAAPASNALDTINQLAGRLLLLQYDFLEQRDDLPPYSPSQAHRLQSQSQTVFKLEHFTRLLANMPFLVALELNQEVTEDVRRSCAHLRFALCQDPRFRLSAFRHVDLVRDAFLKPTKLSGATAALEGHLVDALRLIVSSDGSCTSCF